MSYGIPYMGSKDRIIASIAMNLPKADHFYDLFGGGFSVSHYMLVNRKSRYKYFHYNEIKKDIVALIKKAINGDFSYEKFKPEWVSYSDFDRLKKSDSYIKICWSFGNNQIDYMYSLNIEPYKKSLHQAVIFDEFNEIAEITLGFDKWPLIAKTIKQKRFYLRQKIEHYRITNTLPKILYQFIPKQLKQLERLLRLQQLEQLERLQQLEQLKRLEQLLQLTMTSEDYRDVDILPNSIVYCDIPYQNTDGYNQIFNHKEFFDWAASRQFPVYISEYNITDKRFKLIYDIEKRSLMSLDKINCKKMTEKLYWNGI